MRPDSLSAFALLALAALVMGFTARPVAAETLPGDVCGTAPLIANSFQWSGAPENGGNVYGMFCNGSTWGSQIRFSSVGLVSINEANPPSWMSPGLFVSGAVASTGTYAGYLAANSNNEGAYYFGESTSGMDGQSNGDTTDSINLRTNSLSRLHIDGNGNVGIGTTSPAASLHTAENAIIGAPAGSTGTELWIKGRRDTADAYAALRFQNQDGGDIYDGVSLEAYNEVTGPQTSSGELVVFTTNNNVAGEVMRLTREQYVGIGGIEPQAPLHVSREVIIGMGTLACAAAQDGALRFTSSTDLWEYCTGSAWTPLVSGLPTCAAGQGLIRGVSAWECCPSPPVTWTGHAAPTTGGWDSVTYGNDLFVAVASSGTNLVMTSPDGITWTTRTAAEANGWVSVTYGNGLFVAVSYNGTNRVMTSPSGVTWTARAAGANVYRSVTYGNGLFVATAESGTNLVMTSPDGITWTGRAAPSGVWYSVIYANGLFVAVSGGAGAQVMTSPDGITWTARTAAAASGWQSVGFGNGLFVAVANNGTTRVMTSPDGITWTARTATEANGWRSVTYANGRFVAVADTGTNRVMTSPDGITWTAQAAAAANSWFDVTYANGKFVAVAIGTNQVMTSPSTPCP